MVRAGRALVALAAGGRMVQRLHAVTLRPLGPPLELPAAVRASAVAVAGGSITVIDPERRRRLTLSAAGVAQLERLVPDVRLKRCS